MQELRRLIQKGLPLSQGIACKKQNSPVWLCVANCRELSLQERFSLRPLALGAFACQLSTAVSFFSSRLSARTQHCELHFPIIPHHPGDIDPRVYLGRHHQSQYRKHHNANESSKTHYLFLPQELYRSSQTAKSTLRQVPRSYSTAEFQKQPVSYPLKMR
jgi:hypothetical protein